MIAVYPPELMFSGIAVKDTSVRQEAYYLFGFSYEKFISLATNPRQQN